MGRPPRAAEPGLIYHALNRGNAGLVLFEGAEDYNAFLGVLALAVERHRTDLLAYCLMPDHFHLVLRPRAEGELSRFMRWLTLTHTQRWHARRRSVGSGHLYQGRFKSFPIQDDGHFLVACRFVEGNALRAGLVQRAEDWPHGSLARRAATRGAPPGPTLAPWPIRRRRGWIGRVNAALGPAEVDALRRAVRRGQPFGSPDWRAETARRLGLESALRPIGRPRKAGVEAARSAGSGEIVR